MICVICEKPLVSIGDRRKNGANHKDWDSRKMHKKCYVSQPRKKSDNPIREELKVLTLNLFKGKKDCDK